MQLCSMYRETLNRYTKVIIVQCKAYECSCRNGGEATSKMSDIPKNVKSDMDILGHFRTF